MNFHNQLAPVGSRHPAIGNLSDEIAFANRAEEFCRLLVARIINFEKSLDAQHEVGLRLVSFGQTITFHVRNLQYHDPSLIVFQGVLEDGSPVELIQNVSQLSFLLMALKRLEPDKDRSELGFHALHQKFQGK